MFGDDVKFTGETATRQWPVYLTGNEAVGVRFFRLSVLNAISDLPEASSVTVLVNDVPIVPLTCALCAICGTTWAMGKS